VLITDWADLWGAGGIAETRRGAERLIGLFDAWWERRFRTWADGATVITSRLGPALEASGIPEHRRMLLPPGANTDLVRPLDRDAARRGLGLPVEAAIVASTGFAPYDEDLLAEVILQVLRGEPSAMVVTSGRPPPALRARLAQHGMDSRARHLGTVPFSEFERVLACADVLLLPYGDREVNRGRFPNRFGDYLASGRAIVTNPTGDLGELAAAHQIAILAPEAPQAFAAEVLRLLRDPVRRDELGRRARAFAEEELSWPILAERVERFYRECLGSGRRLASAE
jgi:glycosyltransferase involved in cell wall biosynthesis